MQMSVSLSWRLSDLECKYMSCSLFLVRVRMRDTLSRQHVNIYLKGSPSRTQNKSRIRCVRRVLRIYVHIVNGGKRIFVSCL